MIKIVSIAALALAMTACASVENVLNAPTSSLKTTTTAINAEKGLVTMQSNHSVQDTADKLVSVIESKGMKVFARVDHQKNAQGVDLTLRPTQVIMFGNPKAGTPLMNCEQTVAIDLPQKSSSARMLIKKYGCLITILNISKPAIISKAVIPSLIISQKH